MKYKVIFHYSSGETEEEDELYDTKEEAREAGEYGCQCYYDGGEILHMSNPGDYPETFDPCDYEIVKARG